jgi:hypothetical protein
MNKAQALPTRSWFRLATDRLTPINDHRRSRVLFIPVPTVILFIENVNTVIVVP